MGKVMIRFGVTILNVGEREDWWPSFRLVNFYNLPRVLYNFDEPHHLLEE